MEHASNDPARSGDSLDTELATTDRLFRQNCSVTKTLQKSRPTSDAHFRIPEKFRRLTTALARAPKTAA